MRTRVRAALVLSCLGWLGQPGCNRARTPAVAAPAVAADELARQLAEVLEQQRAAWNRGDIVAFMAAYVHDDTLVFTSGGQVRRGYDATLARYRARYADAGAMGELRFWALETTALGDDAALVLGRWRLEHTPEAGEGVFSLVFVRRDGRWQIVHDHTSALSAAAPATTADPP